MSERVLSDPSTTTTTTRKNKTKKKQQQHHHHVHKHHSKRNNRTRTRRTRKKKVKSSKSNKSDPCKGVFCPHKSKSFEAVTCASRKCKVDLSELFSLSVCPKPSDPCLYDIRLVNLFFLCFILFFLIDTDVINLLVC